MEQQIRAVLFDMDGLMFDTERLGDEVWRAVAGKYGVTMTPEDVSLLRGRNYESGRRAFLERFGAGFHYDDMSAEVWREVEARLEHSVPLRPGLFELLVALRARGCKMAVASSTDSARVLHNLETAGVRGYFSAVIGGDQVTHSKPEPEIFLKAAASARSMRRPLGTTSSIRCFCRRAFRKRPSPTLWCAAFHCALCRSWRRAGWTTAWWIPCCAC